MKPTEKELAAALASMTAEEISDLRDAEQQRQIDEAQRRKNAVLPDGVGTIRADPRNEEVLWVRHAGKSWEPFIQDNHGVGLNDWDRDFAGMPVVGLMPGPWVDKEADDEKYYTEFGEEKNY